MSRLKLPCKDCISFAICYNIETIRCEQLYKFLSKTSNYKESPVGELHWGYIKGRPKYIKELFNRYVKSTDIFGYKIKLTKERKSRLKMKELYYE